MNRPFDLDAARRRSRCKTTEPAPSAFTTAAQREWLTPRGFTLLQRAITDGHGLTEDLAHEVARALRGWAANRGATHVAFRVHPLSGEPTEYRLALSRLTGDDLVGGTRATAPAVRATWSAVGTPWRADLAGNSGATRGGAGDSGVTRAATTTPSGPGDSRGTRRASRTSASSRAGPCSACRPCSRPTRARRWITGCR